MSAASVYTRLFNFVNVLHRDRQDQGFGSASISSGSGSRVLKTIADPDPETDPDPRPDFKGEKAKKKCCALLFKYFYKYEN